MYVKINRNECSAPLSFCERCLGRFLKYPMGYERRCFEELKEDGNPDILTLDITTGNKRMIMKLNEEERLRMAGDGWAYFVDFAVPMYRDKQPQE